MAGLTTTVLGHLRDHLQVVTRRQLLEELGCTRGEISGWLKRGHLVRVHRGVYRLPGIRLTTEQRVYAAVLRTGRGAVAGPLSSLALHDIEGFGVPRTLDVCRKNVGELRKVDFTVAAMPLPRDDVMKIGVIPVLSVARALIEVADEQPAKKIRVAFDDGRRQDLVTVPHLRRRVNAQRSRPGAAVILQMLDGGTFDQESEGERVMKPLLEEVFPGEHLEWGVKDLVPGRRLDAAIRRLLMAFEYDGRNHHIFPTDRDADGLRDLECGAKGVITARISKGMLRDARVRTAASLAALAARRALDLGVPPPESTASGASGERRIPAG